MYEPFKPPVVATDAPASPLRLTSLFAAAGINCLPATEASMPIVRPPTNLSSVDAVLIVPVKLLSKHKNVLIKYLCGNSSVGKKISYFDKSLKSKKLPNIVKFNKSYLKDVDVVFTALPNGEAQDISSNLLSKKENIFDSCPLPSTVIADACSQSLQILVHL